MRIHRIITILKSHARRITMLLVLTSLVLASLILTSCSDKLRATTIRLIRQEGTIELTGNDGRARNLKDQQRFQNGDTLRTMVKSLAGLSLDDAKAVLMNEESCAGFHQEQKGKWLQIDLTEGDLFFAVDEKLKDDENFEIHTSTMVIGIRGTSGYVTADSEGRDMLIVTDGTVHVSGINPTTGEIIEEDVSAGHQVTVYLFDRPTNSVKFHLENVSEKDLSSFPLVSITAEEPRLKKVCDATGWDPELLKRQAGNLPEEEAWIADAVGLTDNLQSTEETKESTAEESSTAESGSAGAGAAESTGEGEESTEAGQESTAAGTRETLGGRNTTQTTAAGTGTRNTQAAGTQNTAGTNAQTAPQNTANTAAAGTTGATDAAANSTDTDAAQNTSTETQEDAALSNDRSILSETEEDFDPNFDDETEAATEAATQAATEAQTAAATEAATQAQTAAATEAATQAQTVAATEAATQAQTEAATQARTEAATDAATYDATGAGTTSSGDTGGSSDGAGSGTSTGSDTAGSDGAGSGTAADTGTSDLVSSTDDPNADSPAAADAGT